MVPPVRTPLEIEASLLDSDVQGLLGTEELAGDETTSGPQLQWATNTEFPSVVRLFELNCCAIPLTAAGREGEVVVPLANGPSGFALHILRTLARWYSSRLLPTSTSQLDVTSEVPEGSVRFSPDGRLPHTPSLACIAAWDERCSVVDEGCVLSSLWHALRSWSLVIFAKFRGPMPQKKIVRPSNVSLASQCSRTLPFETTAADRSRPPGKIVMDHCQHVATKL